MALKYFIEVKFIKFSTVVDRKVIKIYQLSSVECFIFFNKLKVNYLIKERYNSKLVYSCKVENNYKAVNKLKIMKKSFIMILL